MTDAVPWFLLDQEARGWKRVQWGRAMSDITHCSGTGCPVKNGCYRYRAIVYGRFDSFGSTPWDATKRTCDEFVDVTEQGPSDDAIRHRAYLLWRAAGSPEGTATDDWHAARRGLEAEHAERLRPPDE